MRPKNWKVSTNNLIIAVVQILVHMTNIRIALAKTTIHTGTNKNIHTNVSSIIKSTSAKRNTKMYPYEYQ